MLALPVGPAEPTCSDTFDVHASSPLPQFSSGASGPAADSVGVASNYFGSHGVELFAEGESGGVVPGDSFETAGDLGTGDLSLSESVIGGGTDHYFQWTANTDGLLTVTLASDEFLEFEILNAGRNSIAGGATFFGSAGSAITPVVAGETNFIRVSNKWSTEESTYGLTITTDPDAIEDLGRGELDIADLTIGERESQWYRWTADAHGRLTVNMNSSTPEAHLVFNIREPSGHWSRIGGFQNDTATASSTPVLADQTYYIRVNEVAGVASEFGLTLTNELYATLDLGAIIGAQDATAHSIEESGADHVFRFETVAHGSATDFVRIDFVHALGDLDMILYDAQGNEVGGSFSVDDFERISLASLPAGTYFALVYGYEGDTNDYTLSINAPVEDAPVDIGLIIPSILNVTTFDDVTDPHDGLLSLREAILLANQTQTQEEDVTIQLDDGTYTFSLGLTLDRDKIPVDNDDGRRGDLDVLPDASVTIVGAGAGATTIDANQMDRVFHVHSNAVLNLEGVTLTGGDGSQGGGIYNSEGIVTITNGAVSDNSGGGISNTGNLILSASVISDNDGGGIRNSGTVTITSTTISGNAGATAGGGISNSGTATITNSTITGNSAAWGGGIDNRGFGSIGSDGEPVEIAATLTIVDSEITGNFATFSGGGIYNGQPGLISIEGGVISGNSTDVNGGGIANWGGLTTFTGTDVHQNSAGSDGGGIWSSGGELSISNVFITANTSSSVRDIGVGGGLYYTSGAVSVAGTVVSGNTGGGIVGSGGALNLLESSIIENSGGGLRIPGSISGSGSVPNTIAIIDSDISRNVGSGIVNDGNTHITVENTNVLNNVGSGIRNGIQGHLTIRSSAISDNNGTGNGGGILNLGPLVVTDSTISGNSTGSNGNGGGIYNTSEMTISNSTISGNQAAFGGVLFRGDGGGVWNSGEAAITNSVIERNVAQELVPNSAAGGHGGGVFNNPSGMLDIRNSVIAGNSADSGGGIYNTGTLRVIDSAISNNSSTQVTGGGGGGGIYNLDGTATFNNSTLSDNSAGFGGGGMFNENGIVTVIDSSILANTADHGGGIFSLGETSHVMVSGTVIANNNAAGNNERGGAGIRNVLGTFDIDSSEIVDNSSEWVGGGIVNQSSGRMFLRNTTVADNTAAAAGGGIYNWSNAQLSVIDGTITGNTSLSNGGGIINWDSSLAIVDKSIISGNSAPNGAGIRNLDGGTITVTDSTISNNSADNGGGGISNSAEFLIFRSTLSHNNARVNGGAIYNAGSGTLAIDRTDIRENTSEFNGGGILTFGSVNINRSTLDQNSAANMGGGLYVTPEGDATLRDSTLSRNTASLDGGAILNGGVLNMVQTTVSGNTAGTGGGALRNWDATAFISHSTLTDNQAGTNISPPFRPGPIVEGNSTQTATPAANQSAGTGTGGGISNAEDGTIFLTHTIVSGNRASLGPDVYSDSSAFTTFVSQGFNLIGGRSGAGFTLLPSDVLDNDPFLGPLQDNGRATWTHMPLLGSPAVDAGNPNFNPSALNPSLTHDQRGMHRQIDALRLGISAIDIGAIELHPSLDVAHREIRRLPKVAFDGVGTDIRLVFTGVDPNHRVQVRVGQSQNAWRSVGGFVNTGGTSSWTIDIDIRGTGLAWVEFVEVASSHSFQLGTPIVIEGSVEEIEDVIIVQPQPSPRPALPLPGTEPDPGHQGPVLRRVDYSGIAKLYRWTGTRWEDLEKDAQGSLLFPDGPTIMLTHGWRDRFLQNETAEYSKWIHDFVTNLERCDARVREEFNIIAVDWSDGGSQNGSLMTTFPILPMSQQSALNGIYAGLRLGRSLKSAGVNPSNLYLMGHSNGGGFMASVAMQVGSVGNQVAKLVTLDTPFATAAHGRVQDAAPYVADVSNYYIRFSQSELGAIGAIGFGWPMHVDGITNFELDRTVSSSFLPKADIAHTKVALRYAQTACSDERLPGDTNWGFQTSIWGTQPRNWRIPQRHYWRETELLATDIVEWREIRTLGAALDHSIATITREAQSIWEASISTSQQVIDTARGISSHIGSLVEDAGSTARRFIRGLANSPIYVAMDVAIPVGTDLLSFDLTVLDGGGENELLVGIDTQAIGEIDLELQELVGGSRFHFNVTDYAGKDVSLHFYMPADEPNSAEFLISQLDFLTLNKFPVMEPIEDLTLIGDDNLNFRAAASDVDGDNLTFGFDEGAPEGASIDPVTGIITWMPTEEQRPGVYFITVFVTDDGPGNLSDLQTFRVALVEYPPPEDVDAGSNVTVNEGDTVQLNGSFTAYAPADTYSFLWQVSADNGQIVDEGNEQDFSFTSEDDGTYEVTFSVMDEEGGTGTASVLVTAENVAPQITSLSLDSDVVQENETVMLAGIFSDSGMRDSHSVTIHWGDGSETIIDLSQSERAFGTSHQYSLAAHPDTSSVMFTIDVSVADNDGGSHAASTMIAVERLNESPLGKNFQVDLLEDQGPQVFDFDADDPDADDDRTTLTYQILAMPEFGQLAVLADGRFQFDPSDDFLDVALGQSKQVTFTYLAVDRHGAESDSATVTVTVEGNRPAQVGVDDLAVAFLDIPVAIGVLTNDLVDQGALVPETVKIVSPPQTGTIVVEANGTIIYTPATGSSGPDTFGYTVETEFGAISNEATVTVTVVLTPWQNPVEPVDVDGDTHVSPLDVLLVINYLNSTGPGPLPIPPAPSDAPTMYLDVDGDNQVSPIDALLVINYLNNPPVADGEAVDPLIPEAHLARLQHTDDAFAEADQGYLHGALNGVIPPDAWLGTPHQVTRGLASPEQNPAELRDSPQPAIAAVGRTRASSGLASRAGRPDNLLTPKLELVLTDIVDDVLQTWNQEAWLNLR